MKNTTSIEASGTTPFRQAVFLYIATRRGYENGNQMAEAMGHLPKHQSVSSRTIKDYFSKKLRKDKHVQARVIRNIAAFLDIDPRYLVKPDDDQDSDEAVIDRLARELDRDIGAAVPGGMARGNDGPDGAANLNPLLEDAVDPQAIADAPINFLDKTNACFHEGQPVEALIRMYQFFRCPAVVEKWLDAEVMAYAYLVKAVVHMGLGYIGAAFFDVADARREAQRTEGEFNTHYLANCDVIEANLNEIIKRDAEAEILLRKAFAGRLRHRGMAPEHDNLQRVGLNLLGRLTGRDEERLKEGLKCFDVADRLAGRLGMPSTTQQLSESEALLGRIARPTTDAKVDRGRQKVAKNLIDEALDGSDARPHTLYMAHALQAKYFVGALERDRAVQHLQKAWGVATQPPIVQTHHVADLLDFAGLHSLFTPEIKEAIGRHMDRCPRCSGADLRHAATCLAHHVRAECLSLRPEAALPTLERLIVSTPPAPGSPSDSRNDTAADAAG